MTEPRPPLETTVEIQFDTKNALCRVRKAFNDLRREGVSCHLRFTEQTVPSVLAPRPLVFITLKDELAFPSTGSLPVQYVDSDGDLAGCKGLGQMVQILLVQNGLDVEWNLDPEQPIMVLAGTASEKA